MRAVGYRQPLPIDDPDALLDLEVDTPVAAGRDLLVKVEAVSVNPVDTKVRRNAQPEGGQPRILGFDAAGTVVTAGPEAHLFHPGDDVFYAGSLVRSGTNAEYHLVDERIVGPKPRTLSFAEAAALPLTSITAWEMLFDRLGLSAPFTGSLLIIGGAGGVGSIAIQLARQLTAARVIATASRPETAAWIKELGAHHTIDHSGEMPAQLRALGLDGVERIFSTTNSDQHFAAVAEMLAPQGKFGLIDDPAAIDVRLLKRKSASLHWEYMFARPVFGTADMEEQHKLLVEVSRLVEQGRIRTTLAEVVGPINAANLRRAHAAIEGGRTRGKLVLAGFE